LTNSITISPNPSSNPTTVTPGLSTANLHFRADTLTNTTANDNINIAGVGTGEIKLNSNVLVSLRNLFYYSETFTAYSIDTPKGWFGNPITLSAIAGPLQGTYGVKLVELPLGSGSSIHRVYNNQTPFTAGTTFTASVYAKAAERSKFIIFHEETAGRVGINVDLLAGTISNYSNAPLSSFITPVGAGWYRVGFTFVATQSGNTVFDVCRLVNDVGAGTYIGDGVSGLYLYGSQFEASSVVTSFVPTTTGSQPGLHATGNITFDGGVTLGDSASDLITFASEVASNIIPRGQAVTTLTAAQQLLNQNSPLFIGIDDETLLYVNPRKALAQTVTPYLAQDGQILYTEDGHPLLINPPNQATVTQFNYNLGASNLTWKTVYSDNITTFKTTTATNILSTTLNAGNIKFNGTSITNLYPADPINLEAVGTGYVSFNGTRLIYGNNFYTNGSVLNLNSTNNGYVKLVGTNGFVTPIGNNSNRPASPIQGQLRYNTQANAQEIYDSSLGWIPTYGATAGSLTETDITDIADLWAIVLG
jgi:hypothetical protein